jgi:hypothetical protein
VTRFSALLSSNTSVRFPFPDGGSYHEGWRNLRGRSFLMVAEWHDPRVHLWLRRPGRGPRYLPHPRLRFPRSPLI